MTGIKDGAILVAGAFTSWARRFMHHAVVVEALTILARRAFEKDQ
jgi:hypothetical protein